MTALVRPLDNIPAGNSGGTAVSIPEGRRFEPGRSGNPRGRPKRDLEVAELARMHTVGAIDILAEIMADRSAPPTARVCAATALLDRGWGRAPQSLDVTQRLTLAEEFEAFMRELQGGRQAVSSVSSRSE